MDWLSGRIVVLVERCPLWVFVVAYAVCMMIAGFFLGKLLSQQSQPVQWNINIQYKDK